MILSKSFLSYNILMKLLFVFALLLFQMTFSKSAFSQDERFFRKIFTGELFHKKYREPKPKILVSSPVYKIDLNRDSEKEGILLEKKDGIDVIKIIDKLGKTLFTHELLGLGKDSRIYKLRLVRIANQTDALIIHFFEGINESTLFQATARLYFLTIDKRNFSKVKVTQGPSYWVEKQKIKDQYWNRFYSINVVDYNQDGRNEISISYNKIQRVYFYMNDGKWSKL